MAEFDEKLNSILGNPEAMAQIMQLAQSLSGSGEQNAAPPPPPPVPETRSALPSNPLAALAGSALGSGGMDSTLLLKLLPLIQELGGEKDSNARRLLYALRPYLKEDRQEKIERALRLAKLFHLGKKFLSEWEG